ncbi:MAG: glycosyltransferase [Candidatus Omnitrophica bacterium]|nr:glycosyltransferase [Candidatus Omnitrophota bacterium]
MNSKSLPIVSFLVPSFNRANLLEQAIGSLLAQSYKNIEIIVIDDASTDGTEGMVRSKFSGVVKYIKNNSNRGVAYSRNLGLSYAKGEFIGLLDSDDILIERDCVETAVNTLESNSELSIFTCDVYCIDLLGNKIYEETFFQTVIDHRNIVLSSGFKDFEYVFFHGIHSCGAVFRKDITKETGFLDTNYKIAWDEDFFLRLSVYNSRAIYYHNEALAGYRIHRGSLSDNHCLYLERIKCRQDILRKNSFIRKRLGIKANKRLAELHISLIDAYLKERKLPQMLFAGIKSVFLYPLILPELFMHALSFSKKRFNSKR